MKSWQMTNFKNFNYKLVPILELYHLENASPKRTFINDGPQI
jgi:hypothetical protein